MPIRISRQDYASWYGPTSGDRVRLADTNLYARIERDDTLPGFEPLVGFGRPVRDGMLAGRDHGPSKLDLVITNVIVMDPVLGIFKSNIGIKDGRIVAIGRAGNPDVMDDIDVLISNATGIIPAEGLIATPGAVDAHVHLSSTSVVAAALSAGITTLVAQGSGGVWDLGVNPVTNLRHLFEAFEAIPLNLAVLGRGSSDTAQLVEHLEAGCAGFKVHEDVGAFPAVIDACLTVADRAGVQVALHTDGLNEAGSLRETIAAIAGRSIHAYHVEGSGGGHAPNVLEIVSEPNIIGSSTSPTIPYARNSTAELFDMIVAVHRLSLSIPTDVAAARDRVRASTIAAEDVLHDLGAIAIMSSDSQGMGRIGEVITRTWQLAHRMKEVRGGGFDPVTGEGDDNPRILQYLAKYTINPAIAHGLDHEVGSLEPGKLADIVLWHPAFFGAKPTAVIKGGFVAWAPVGDGMGSTRWSQPLIYRPMFGGLGRAPAALSLAFVAPVAAAAQRFERFGLQRRAVPVRDTRRTFKAAMRYNTASPRVVVDPKTLEVSVEGAVIDIPPAEELPLTFRSFIA
ncbi:urease subunit alpha [Thermomicrobium sp. 4228-Ro]|uniref:urease subunit alpha n=1 Tax=Thermomicrobium sp. 4228-Ro TaxID=2993937 RepID=UPI0022496DCF|nr:urease subunit alpha [Thermomicrobium sp. 4228-Ro]MCX2726330.1 urease subunit alpha [Thermomicrobium sp. 4228-Ro]